MALVALGPQGVVEIKIIKGLKDLNVLKAPITLITPITLWADNKKKTEPQAWDSVFWLLHCCSLAYFL